MQVMEAIASRRSIRSFRPDPVENDKLVRISEAFCLAPSAANAQNWKLLIVTDPKKREALRNAALGAPEWLKNAPVLLVACGLHAGVMTCGHRSDTTDVSIAMAYCILTAWELGLGTCWMASYREQDVRAALGLAEDVSVVMITPLGYPAEIPAARLRKPVEDVVARIDD